MSIYHLPETTLSLEGEWSTTLVPCHPSLMEESLWIEKGYITSLWKEKDHLDLLFREGKEALYYQTRDRLFPQDKRGSRSNANRAGDKLQEVMQLVKLTPSGSFLDICGGPGAFSKLLLSQGCRGWGITLRNATRGGVGWYPELLQNPRFTVMWGVDGTGSIYPLPNICSLSHLRVGLVTADGGFSLTSQMDGSLTENHQEIYCSRLILSELLIGLETLLPGGSLIIKMFDTVTDLSASILYLVSSLFQRVYLVKPRRSRGVNSERYLTALSLREERQLPLIIGHLYFLLGKMESEPHLLPRTVTPLPPPESSWMVHLKRINTEIVGGQIASLRKVFQAM